MATTKTQSQKTQWV